MTPEDMKRLFEDYEYGRNFQRGDVLKSRKGLDANPDIGGGMVIVLGQEPNRDWYNALAQNTSKHATPEGRFLTVRINGHNWERA